jgi:hypothetical protein
MEQPNINSGDDYAQVLMDTIIEGEKSLPEDEQMPINLITHLSKLVYEKANEYWAEYIIGKRDTFMFGDDEMTDMFNKAGELYVSDMLDSLVDKDMLEVSIGEDGEFLYGLTELGKQAAEADNIKKRGRKPKK